MSLTARTLVMDGQILRYVIVIPAQHNSVISVQTGIQMRESFVILCQIAHFQSRVSISTNSTR